MNAVLIELVDDEIAGDHVHHDGINLTICHRGQCTIAGRVYFNFVVRQIAHDVHERQIILRHGYCSYFSLFDLNVFIDGWVVSNIFVSQQKMLFPLIGVGGTQQIDLPPLERFNGSRPGGISLHQDLDVQQMGQHADDVGRHPFIGIRPQGDVHGGVVGSGHPQDQPLALLQPAPLLPMQRQGAGIEVFPAIPRIDLQQGLFRFPGRQRPHPDQRQQKQQQFRPVHSSFCRLARLIRSTMLVMLSFFINRVL